MSHCSSYIYVAQCDRVLPSCVMYILGVWCLCCVVVQFVLSFSFCVQKYVIKLISIVKQISVSYVHVLNVVFYTAIGSVN
jgi:hypothetical protein